VQTFILKSCLIDGEELKMEARYEMVSYRKSFIIIELFSLVLFIVGCNNDIKKFMEVSNGLAKNINQLQKEPGITLTGYVSEPSQKLFKIGIGIDHNKLTTERLKQIIESYLENSASYTSEHDPMKMLKPYNLRIEEIGKDKTNFPLVADKFSGSNEINWSN
jgi:hypothetical protein